MKTIASLGRNLAVIAAFGCSSASVFAQLVTQSSSQGIATAVESAARLGDRATDRSGISLLESALLSHQPFLLAARGAEVSLEDLGAVTTAFSLDTELLYLPRREESPSTHLPGLISERALLLEQENPRV
jgi:hypothetical protein